VNRLGSAGSTAVFRRAVESQGCFAGRFFRGGHVMRRHLLGFWGASSSLFLVTTLAAAQGQLVVEKMEPPHWWNGMRTTVIELLLTGERLDGLCVQPAKPGITAASVVTSRNGHYAFVELNIDPGTPAGSYALTLTNATGRTVLQFPIKERLSSKGRFQGIDTKDIIYLIMPDRFARSSDASHSRLPLAKRIDRSDLRARHGGNIEGIVK